MKGITILIIVLCVVLVVCLACFLIYCVRKKRSRKKVCQMCMSEKLQLLQKLVEPFGFFYMPEEDIFTTRLDAWQRAAGYEALFDKTAVHFHMVLDAWPVYFDYEGKTWLVELWKGQYGINTGAEIGIYHADGIVAEKDRKRAHFHAVDNSEMPGISYCLEKGEKTLFCIKKLHWWLGAFRMGEFSKPSELNLTASIRFRDRRQAECFYKGLLESGYMVSKYPVQCNEVHVCMDFCQKYSWRQRFYRAFIQLQNQLCCRLFRFVTRPFRCTVDRLLFLYFQLPYCFRKMMQKPARRKRRCL